MLTLVIIDDEQDARSTLTLFLTQYCPDIEIAGEAADVSSGVALIRSLNPNIVLLDIHLKAANGFDLLNKFTNPSFRVIFITAFDSYALKAFQYCALDYVLKPIDPNRLINAIDKAKESIQKEISFQQQIESLQNINRTKTFEKIALPSSEGIIFISLMDIIYLKSDTSYTTFYTCKNEKVVVSKSLKDFENILPDDVFFRTHQSYILNIHFIKKVLKEDGGYALLESGEKIPISRRKKEGFLNMLNL